MRLIDFVLLGRNAHLGLTKWETNQDIKKAMAAMKLTDIDDLSERTLGQISGGELQRAMLAMAITQESPVMLLDEPTSNLDLSHQSKVLNLLIKMHNEKRGITVMAIHDLTLAAQYSDRMILISEGQIFADGKPSEVLTKNNIAETYGADVIIIPHPKGGSPVILPTSEDYPKVI